jgi:thiamine biosynthesis lipoprotein
MALRRLLLVSVFLLGACDAPQLNLAGNAMGTTFNVSIVEPAETLNTDTLEADIVSALTRIDLLASTWRTDSELSVFNADQAIDWIIISPEFCDALTRTFEISRQTGGAYDVTIGPLVNLWGFGPGGPVAAPPTDEAIEDAMQSVGYDKIEADCPEGLVRKDVADMYVDLSGWAKGLAVDELAVLLDANGVANYLVEIGGEMRVKGYNSDKVDWAVGIEAPSTSERVPQSILRVTNTSVATSGDYRNYFEHDGNHYSHTIDPRTGRPITHNLAAVTVVHPSAAYADALATALLVLGPTDGPALATKLEIAAYFLVRNNGTVTEITTSAFDTLGTS